MSTLMKKRTYARKNNQSLPAKVQRIERAIRSAKPEVKQENVSVLIVTGAAVAYPPLVVISQGVGSNQRVGEEIKLLGFSIRFGTTGNSAGPPAMLEPFSVRPGMPLLVPGSDQPLFELDKTKYRSLQRTQINGLASNSGTTGVPVLPTLKMKFRYPITVRFDGVTSVASSNQIYLRWCSSLGLSGGVAVTPTITGNVTLYYTDS